MAEEKKSNGGERRGSGDGTECADGTTNAAAPAVATVDLPFPGYVATAFYRLPQTSWPRRWCLALITWPYPCCTAQPVGLFTADVYSSICTYIFISSANLLNKDKTQNTLKYSSQEAQLSLG